MSGYNTMLSDIAAFAAVLGEVPWHTTHSVLQCGSLDLCAAQVKDVSLIMLLLLMLWQSMFNDRVSPRCFMHCSCKVCL